MNLPPLNIILSSKTNQLISVSSIDDCTWIDVSGAEYADVVSIDAIFNAVTEPKIANVKIIRNDEYISRFKEVGVLVLYVGKNTILIIDEKRDYFIELR